MSWTPHVPTAGSSRQSPPNHVPAPQPHAGLAEHPFSLCSHPPPGWPRRSSFADGGDKSEEGSQEDRRSRVQSACGAGGRWRGGAPSGARSWVTPGKPSTTPTPSSCPCGLQASPSGGAGVRRTGRRQTGVGGGPRAGGRTGGSRPAGRPGVSCAAASGLGLPSGRDSSVPAPASFPLCSKRVPKRRHWRSSCPPRSAASAASDPQRENHPFAVAGALLPRLSPRIVPGSRAAIGPGPLAVSGPSLRLLVRSPRPQCPQGPQSQGRGRSGAVLAPPADCLDLLCSSPLSASETSCLGNLLERPSSFLFRFLPPASSSPCAQLYDTPLEGHSNLSVGFP